MEKYNNGKEVSRMTRCVHMFHTHCIQKACEISQRCPTCRVCGPKMEGNCPPGRMSWKVVDNLYGRRRLRRRRRRRTNKRLAGYEDCKVIEVLYEMNGGYQDSRHQNPGVWFGYGVERLLTRQSGRKSCPRLVQKSLEDEEDVHCRKKYKFK